MHGYAGVGRSSSTQCVLISPEGTRSSTGQLLAFKKGDPP